MDLRSLFVRVAIATFLIYMAGGVIVSVVAIQGAQRDVAADFNELISNSVAEMVSEALKLGSFVEARARIQKFIDKGVFVCADLDYDGMPLSKCISNKDNLRPFAVTMKLSEQIGFRNPVLTTYVDERKLSSSAFKRSLEILLYVLAFGFFFLFLLAFFLRKFVAEIQSVSDEIHGIEKFQGQESFVTEINILRKRMAEYISLKQREAHADVLMQTSRQVSHDIRSPLSALNIAMHGLSEISEERRVLIHSAVQRINNIANDLLQKGKQAQGQEGIPQSNHNKVFNSSDPHVKEFQTKNIFLPIIVGNIVSEKRIQFRDKLNVKVEADLKESEEAFVVADETEFGRLISNLVNNSVESFSDNMGEVFVAVRAYQSEVLLMVSDNGKGIPSHILARLGEHGISYGKKGTESGSGLGIYHAKKTVEEWGGKFEVRSREGIGTAIEIKLPKSAAARQKL